MHDQMEINKLAKASEKLIIYALILMMASVLILSTIELGHFLVKSIASSNYLLIDLDALMDLFGVFLLVLIGIELLDTIKIYLRENLVHVEVVVLVAIIAVARKVVVLKVEELSGVVIIGIGFLVLSLSVAYYLIKRAGTFTIDLTAKDKQSDDHDR
jgi:uncharacterized membrane protein (DUF373 family)